MKSAFVRRQMSEGGSQGAERTSAATRWRRRRRAVACERRRNTIGSASAHVMTAAEAEVREVETAAEDVSLETGSGASGSF
jgi:hypothetical protein